VSADAPASPAVAEDSEPDVPRLGRPPRSRGAWVALGVVVIVVVAGVAVVVYRDHLFVNASAPTATISLGPPSFKTVACGPTETVYDMVQFPIENVTGHPSTAEFGLAILSRFNTTVSPNGTAPSPQSNLPCAAPIPQGWYAELYGGITGAIATFPVVGFGGASVWSNATSSPASPSAGENFILVTDGDFTGSGYHLASYGTGAEGVALEGNTTFPSYEHP
jgi:hypothetical protein